MFFVLSGESGVQGGLFLPSCTHNHNTHYLCIMKYCCCYWRIDLYFECWVSVCSWATIVWMWKERQSPSIMLSKEDGATSCKSFHVICVCNVVYIVVGFMYVGKVTLLTQMLVEFEQVGCHLPCALPCTYLCACKNSHVWPWILLAISFLLYIICSYHIIWAIYQICSVNFLWLSRM
jgi:hypothetical protein